MSARMQIPLSQRRHTNVAVVRHTKNGVRLEIACYKNKVISYRAGIETRMDEVLQVERVFTNVSRGLYASEKEIQTVFGEGASEKEALQYILDHGELQVAQQERAAEIDQMFIDIAVIISQKCLNEVTRRPFPSQVIEQALRSIGAVVKLDQPVKKQALALIHQLMDAKIIPIARARMKLRCVAPDEPSLERLVGWCESNDASILRRVTDAGDADAAAHTHSLLILLQPHLFREIEKFVKSELPPGGTVHTIESAAVDVGEGDVMDAELIARANAHVTGAGGVRNAATSLRTGSSSGNPHTDGGRGRTKGKGGGRNPQGVRRVPGRDGDTDEQTATTAELSSTPAEADGDGDDLKAALSRLALAEKSASDDEEADGRGRRGKRKAKRRQGRQPQQPLSVTPKEVVGVEGQEGSDDEVLVNRKQRKQAAAKVKAKDDGAHQGWSDDGDDGAYGHGCEEGESGE
ncbi:SBDS-like protein [Trypanosoma conorhini]|uniref:SBDS-like protein n=1 Tax=Trypanosoma conorhini TaxID=83891 RepID=A0A3S5IU63_9TRYP|nr:SBDS-like protein [Trypanosoma conorhini]RNF24700.1 SBDS-like protein [Trypanosoma conorhini]